MSYAVVHHFPEGTKAQYEATLAAVHPDEGRALPKGQIFHATGPSQGGWTIVAVHDSKQSWERFRDDVLMPKLQTGVEGGFHGSPEEIAFEVHRLMEGTEAR